MPAAHEQRDGRVLERRRIGVEDVGGDVPDEVVDGVQRALERHRERLRRADADHEGAREPGPRCHRDRVDVGERDPRLGERGLDRRLQRLEMRAGGDFGHDPAVAGMLVHRARDRVREQRAAADDADAGLVAARLDAEDERFAAVHVHAPASRGRAVAPVQANRRIQDDAGPESS